MEIKEALRRAIDEAEVAGLKELSEALSAHLASLEVEKVEWHVPTLEWWREHPEVDWVSTDECGCVKKWHGASPVKGKDHTSSPPTGAWLGGGSAGVYLDHLVTCVKYHDRHAAPLAPCPSWQSSLIARPKEADEPVSEAAPPPTKPGEYIAKTGEDGIEIHYVDPNIQESFGGKWVRPVSQPEKVDHLGEAKAILARAAGNGVATAQAHAVIAGVEVLREILEVMRGDKK